MSDIRRRECVIRPMSYELKSGGWIPEASVFIHRGDSVIEQLLHAAEGIVLKTQDDADNYAVGMSIRWIDQNHPFPN